MKIKNNEKNFSDKDMDFSDKFITWLCVIFCSFLLVVAFCVIFVEFGVTDFIIYALFVAVFNLVAFKSRFNPYKNENWHNSYFNNNDSQDVADWKRCNDEYPESVAYWKLFVAFKLHVIATVVSLVLAWVILSFF